MCYNIDIFPICSRPAPIILVNQSCTNHQHIDSFYVRSDILTSIHFETNTSYTVKERLKAAFSLRNAAERAVASWLAAVVLSVILSSVPFYDISFSFSASLPRFVISAVGFFVSMTALRFAFPAVETDAALMAATFFTGSVIFILAWREFWFVLALICVSAVMLLYLCRDDRFSLSQIKLNGKSAFVVSACAFVFSAAVIAYIGCMRYKTYASPNFDLGVFANIFHNLKTKLLPIVSSEREQIVSHFTIHLSPVFYLLLPVYAVFPNAMTLQIGQAVIIASGVFPLYLLARHYGLSSKLTALIALCYALNPGLSAATLYDFHENCFLVPFLLWAFYFFEKKKYNPGYLFVVLTWTVKEDAPLFTLFFGLFLLLSQKKYLHGSIVTAISAAYFCAALLMLSRYGEGAMTLRFANFIYKDEGLLGMARILITDPAYALTQIFSSDKMIFLLELLLPLAFLPIAGKKISRLVLLVPFIAECLLTNYQYQFSIYFQYTLGPLACMLYLSVISSSESQTKTRRFAWCAAAAASLMIFTMTSGATVVSLNSGMKQNKETFERLDSYLEEIPTQYSVKACSFFVPHVSDRDNVCELSSPRKTDIVLIDLRGGAIQENNEAFKSCLLDGYEIVKQEQELIAILARPEISEEIGSLQLGG